MKVPLGAIKEYIKEYNTKLLGPSKYTELINDIDLKDRKKEQARLDDLDKRIRNLQSGLLSKDTPVDPGYGEIYAP
jgi:hypothetical protein